MTATHSNGFWRTLFTEPDAPADPVLGAIRGLTYILCGCVVAGIGALAVWHGLVKP